MIRHRAAILSLLLLACGAGAGPALEPMPLRATTAGQSLLASAPLGADLLLELDLERLRNNPVVGALLSSVAAPDAAETVDLLQQAEVALVLVYDVGSSPRQLVILRAAQSLPGAVALGDRVFAVGDARLLTLAAGIQGPEQSMLADSELLRLRDEVMPAEAREASLRLSLRLDFDARVSIASKIEISDVPISVAVWGDVVDDMALIAHLGSDEAEDAPRLTRAILGLRTRVAANVYARSLGLSEPIRDARVTSSGKRVTVLLLVGPKRLQYVVTRLLKQLSNLKT